MNTSPSLGARYVVARTQWHTALVIAQRFGTQDSRSMAALKRAEVEFIAAHNADQMWRRVVARTYPRFRRMPKINPYALASAAVVVAA